MRWILNDRTRFPLYVITINLLPNLDDPGAGKRIFIEIQGRPFHVNHLNCHSDTHTILFISLQKIGFMKFR